jgi:hypothetical protein
MSDLGAVKANGPLGRRAIDWWHEPSIETQI